MLMCAQIYLGMRLKCLYVYLHYTQVFVCLSRFRNLNRVVQFSRINHHMNICIRNSRDCANISIIFLLKVSITHVFMKNCKRNVRICVYILHTIVTANSIRYHLQKKRVHVTCYFYTFRSIYILYIL